MTIYIVNNFINNLMNASDLRNVKIRAVSARPASRPLSGHSGQNKISQKTDFIQNVYGGVSIHSGTTSIRKSFHLVASKTELDSLSKYVPKKSLKDKQELFEDNLRMRKQINKLNQQMAILKGQMQNIKKPMNRANKQLSMQFEKELYWTGSNAHQVAGVKAQYEKLKQMYQAKCQQCDSIKIEAQFTQIQQFKVYSEALQNQNKRLVEKLQKYVEQSQQFVVGKEKQQISEFLVAELQEKKQKLQKKLVETENKLKTSNEIVKDRDKKIMFIEKLLIEKGNNQYHANRKVKKLQGEKEALDKEVQDLRKEMKETIKIHQQEVKEMKDNEEQKFQLEKGLFDRNISEKNIKIDKLEKEVAYLSTLLTYWKPIDEINRQVADKIIHDDGQRDQKGSAAMSNSVRYGKNQISLGGNIVPVKNRRGSAAVEDISSRGEFVLKNDSIVGNLSKVENKQEKSRKRVPQTAGERHSETAQKKRKVKIDEVEQIGILLRYRFMAQYISIQQVKKYFDYKGQKNNSFAIEENKIQKSEITEQQLWAKTYISMKEVIEVLQQATFNLGKEDALLLARYLVEDSHEQYVYCDENNEILRTVLKSILKGTVVGEYEILEEKRRKEVEFQLQDTIQKFKDNLGPALRTVAPSGFTSSKKFLELVNSLGIQISEQCREMFIAKMSMQSESLSKLKYGLWF